MGWGFAIPSRAADYSFPKANEGQIVEAQNKIVPLRFLPSHPLYFLITIKEIFSRAFQPSSAKRAEFDFILAGKRLKESFLLLEKNEEGSAAKSLRKYKKSISNMSSNLNRARAQNQEVKPFVEFIADGLKNHEALFYAISKKVETSGDDGLRTSFSQAIEGFVDVIDTLESVRPGLKNRFKTASESANVEGSEATAEADFVMPTPVPNYKPRRIIY